MSVDLPQPLGPRIAVCSPRFSFREKSSSTTRSPRMTLTCSSSRSGSFMSWFGETIRVARIALSDCDSHRIAARHADECLVCAAAGGCRNTDIHLHNPVHQSRRLPEIEHLRGLAIHEGDE